MSTSPSALGRHLSAKASSAVSTSLTVDKANEEPGGNQGFTKNSGVRGVDVSGIPRGILGLLPRISCAKA